MLLRIQSISVLWVIDMLVVVLLGFIFWGSGIVAKVKEVINVVAIIVVVLVMILLLYFICRVLEHHVQVKGWHLRGHRLTVTIHTVMWC